MFETVSSVTDMIETVSSVTDMIETVSSVTGYRFSTIRNVEVKDMSVQARIMKWTPQLSVFNKTF